MLKKTQDSMIPKIESWFIFALLAFIAWGFWGFFPKLALKYMDERSILVFEVVGAIVMGLIVFTSLGFKVQAQPTGITFAILSGLMGSIGGFFFLYALRKGNASVVVATTALYPLVTILLTYFFLNESITIKQGIGIILALIAMVLFVI